LAGGRLLAAGYDLGAASLRCKTLNNFSKACYSLPCLPSSNPPPRFALNFLAALSPLSLAEPLLPYSSSHILLLTAHRPLTCPVGVTAPYRLKSFSCNTYGFPRKCGKQKTYGTAKPFRCNTYKKHGGGREIPPSSERFNACFRPILFPFTLLRTLLQPPRTQLFCFQEIPHSLAKTPGVGVHLHS